MALDLKSANEIVPTIDIAKYANAMHLELPRRLMPRRGRALRATDTDVYSDSCPTVVTVVVVSHE